MTHLSRQAGATVTVLAALAALTASALLAGCGAGSPSQRFSATAAPTSRQASPQPVGPAASFPATPAGRQLAWVVGHMNSGSVPSSAVLARHFLQRTAERFGMGHAHQRRMPALRSRRPDTAIYPQSAHPGQASSRYVWHLAESSPFDPTAQVSARSEGASRVGNELIAPSNLEKAEGT